jgi:hypothetical protein
LNSAGAKKAVIVTNDKLAANSYGSIDVEYYVTGAQAARAVESDGRSGLDDGGMVRSNALVLGRGTAITKHVSVMASLSFAGIVAPNCAPDALVEVPGAAEGDTVSLGVPNRSVPLGVQFFAWVSSRDRVSIRSCAFTGQPTPSSGAFRVDVWGH